MLTAVFERTSSSGGGSSGGGYTPPSTPTYPPTVEKPGEGGGTPTISPSNPKPGDTVTVKPKPDEGYEVDKITVTDKNGKPIEVVVRPDGTYTFKQPDGKVKIEVSYKEINTPWVNPFADVSEGDWYYEAVQFVQEQGLMSGYSDGRFAPEDTLSRSQLAQILFNKEGRPGVSGGGFDDVDSSAWYAEAVRWAAEGKRDLQADQMEVCTGRLAEKQQRHAQLTAEANELEARRTTGFDGSSLNEKLPDLYARHEELLKEKPDGPELTQEVDAQIQAAAQALEQIRAREYQSQYTKQLADTQARIEGLRREVSRQRHILSGLKPGVQCPMCKQTVTEETLPQVRKEFTVSVNELCRQGQAQTGQLKELQELDAKARAVFEQFQQEDVAKAETALSALKEKRRRMVEDSQNRSAERRSEIDRLHAEIQNTELDLEYGMLSPEEGEHLRQIKEELTALSAEISVLTEQDQADPAAELDIAPLETAKKEKQALLSAVASYIARRVELRLSKLQMNRVSISLYSVMKTTGEVKDLGWRIGRWILNGRPQQRILQQSV